jgi:hypothetical protein
MNRRVIYVLFFVMSLVFLGGCGSGGGAGAGTGTVSMDIADARPFIDGEQPDEIRVIFDSVSVHTSGGGWVPLDLPETPLEINLLAFSDGLKTELATPTLIPAGHITQIRFEIRRAYMVFYGASPNVLEIDLDVPSGTLKTDKQIDWTLTDGGAMSLTIHFDLSQSIVLSGQEYKLKPVLHLFNNDPDEAATICGNVDAASFVGAGDPQTVAVSVLWNGVETYTLVTVPKDPDVDPTRFCIYWLVPLDAGESYTIRIVNGLDQSYQEDVAYPELGTGESFNLNDNTAISIP